MVVALLALSGLITLGGLTILSVQGGLSTSGHDRFQSIALYAAESGAAAGMDYLRKTYDTSTFWSAFVSISNANVQAPPGIPGNGAQPGDAENLFHEDMQAWYEVQVLNNRDDPRLNDTGADSDQRVILRSTGHGPNGTVAIIEWEVKGGGNPGPGRPCPSYGQKGMAEDGAGRNDCLTNVDATQTATYRPGDAP